MVGSNENDKKLAAELVLILQIHIKVHCFKSDTGSE